MENTNINQNPNTNSNPNKYNIGDYIFVDNKYIGCIVKIVWNSNGYIIKLENNDEYIDKTLSQYNLIDFDNINGYMLVTYNDSIQLIDFNKIDDILLNYNQI